LPCPCCDGYGLQQFVEQDAVGAWGHDDTSDDCPPGGDNAYHHATHDDNADDDSSHDNDADDGSSHDHDAHYRARDDYNDGVVHNYLRWVRRTGC
jgi:hypothetical protein